MKSAALLVNKVKGAAQQVGFDAVGICDLRPFDSEPLRRWLAAGYGGPLTYMHRQAERRARPAAIVPGARRAVVILKNYYQHMAGPAASRGARVSCYAWGEDYHRVVGDQLAGLAKALIDMGSSPHVTRWYVDAGPVPERALAQRAGLGWIAKNTMLIHPRLGSFTFIGVVFSDLDLPTDPPYPFDRCGRCRRCLDACPTNALAAPRVLDARRCISTLTVEQRGPFAENQGAMICEWVFGCDICQEVCPWNRKLARATCEPRFVPRPELVRPVLRDLVQMDNHTFQVRFGGTALKRAGLAGITRNARQVTKNLGLELAADESRRGG